LTDTIDKADVDSNHEAKYASLLRRVPRRTGKITGVSTTNNYQLVSGSEIMAADCDSVTYVVEETGTDAIDAKVVGRLYDTEGNASAWIDQSETTGISDGAQEVDPGTNDFDEYGLLVKSNSTDTPGDVTVHGLAKSTS